MASLHTNGIKGFPPDIPNSIKILIVDDHPLTCKGYSMLLGLANKEGLLPKINIVLAHSCQQAYEILYPLKKKRAFPSLIILDIRLPAFPQKNIFNGEDLGKLIRRLNKKIKILVITSLRDPYRLQSILKSLNPEGLLLKSEVYDKTLILAFQRILKGAPYYSPTVMRIIKNQLIGGNEITLHERRFLYLLSTGVQSKEIPKHLPWSVSKVEKQKRILKEKLGVEEKSAWGLIHKAKELGVI
ncbi:MAG: response regulator [Bacteroidota bacterium]